MDSGTGSNPVVSALLEVAVRDVDAGGHELNHVDHVLEDRDWDAEPRDPLQATRQGGGRRLAMAVEMRAGKSRSADVGEWWWPRLG